MSARPIPLPELPRWKCHKVVSASKIRMLEEKSTTPFDPENAWWLTLHLQDGLMSVETFAWRDKHKPQTGWYYVVYEDGYTSASPAEAFEAGYALIPDMPDYQQRVVDELSDLSVKCAKLREFVFSNPTYQRLPETGRILLDQQLWIMCGYENILKQRVRKFSSAPKVWSHLNPERSAEEIARYWRNIPTQEQLKDEMRRLEKTNPALFALAKSKLTSMRASRDAPNFDMVGSGEVSRAQAFGYLGAAATTLGGKPFDWTSLQQSRKFTSEEEAQETQSPPTP